MKEAILLNNDLSKEVQIFNLIASIGLIVFLVLAIGFVIVLIIYASIISKKSEEKYQNDVFIALKSNCKFDILKENVQQIYQTYTTKISGYLNVYALNNRLIEKIRDKKIDKNLSEKDIIKYCKLLTDLNTSFSDDYIYSDEKLGVLLNKINDYDIKNELKLMVYCVNEYNNGRIREKEIEISNLKVKKKNRTIITIIGYISGIIGFISSIVTIFHL